MSKRINPCLPLLVGRRLELNPMLVFLALWFGGFFWGIAGIVLATPALVALKVVAENSTHGQPLLEFLSPPATAVLKGVDRESVAGGAFAVSAVKSTELPKPAVEYTA